MKIFIKCDNLPDETRREIENFIENNIDCLSIGKDFYISFVNDDDNYTLRYEKFEIKKITKIKSGASFDPKSIFQNDLGTETIVITENIEFSDKDKEYILEEGYTTLNASKESTSIS